MIETKPPHYIAFRIWTKLLTFGINCEFIEIIFIIVVTALADCFDQIKSDYRQIHLFETCRHVTVIHGSIMQSENT